MKKHNISRELYTFKNNAKNDVMFGSMVLRPIFSNNGLSMELIKMKKSSEIGFFYESEKEEGEKEEETIDLFYIVEGTIRFIKKGKVLQKGDSFSLSNLAKDTEYIVLKNTEILHISFDNQEQFSEIMQSIETLVATGTKCLEKDEYTDGHNYRVCVYAEAIGRKLNLDNSEIVAIGTSARFHDVGKVEIEDDILFKQGALTDEEFEHIKSHTKYGYEMTKDYTNKSIGIMIRQHHERLDGTGYPDGIKDEELLFGSQIISVADIYDALATRRPYKEPLEPTKALAILYENADKHYKKEIVDALKEILIEKDLI